MNGERQGPIPNRWLRCPRRAKELIIDKFIAFKTPLDDSYDDQVPLEYRFYPSMIFDVCKIKNINLRLWIDLTFTKRFYRHRLIEDRGCNYLKLQCRGHGETPSVEQTNTFIRLVYNFILKNPLGAIGVHCTHGFNRTGFLIVSYLVEKEDCSLEVALDMFAKARPPGIYKEDYLKELYKRYEDIKDTPPPPALPDWCFEDEELSETSYSESSDGGCSTSYTPKKSNKKRNKQLPQFMEGVPGVYPFVEEPQAFRLQQQVQRMCKWDKKGFPGSQPVSMDMENIWHLNKKPYRVSWKADGMRYMMLINGPGEVYFFDRDHNVFKVQGLRFPHRKDFNRHLKDTLIDGEMVIDKVNGENIPRYLAYDIIKFEGQDVGQMEFFPTRLQCILNEIINPRYQAIETGLINKTLEPFSVRNKQFWHVTQATSLLGEKFAKSLSHEPDGLIFQPSKEPYIPGRCDEVLKWKPIELNSVDFRLKIVKQEGAGIVSRKVGQLYVGQLDAPFAAMKFTNAIKDLDNKIIECKFENGQWMFMRERTDKSFPNSYNTAMGVCGSIKNPVTKEKLLEFIDHYKYDDDSEIMPPPPKRVRR